MNRILIDTNIYSNAMKGNPAVTDVLQRVSHIGITAISIGELLSGFSAGKRENKNREELAIFLDSPRVRIYHIDEDTAEYYNAILNQLKNQGTRIPTNDIWIGAAAFQHGLQLFTLDKHFRFIKGLILMKM